MWEVGYEVLGDEDGTIIDTFQVLGDGQYEVPEDVASTPTIATTLSIRVTDVEDVSDMFGD